MPVRLGKEIQEMPRCSGLRIVARLPDGLTWQAVRAAKQIKFIPATVNAWPVSMFMQLEYNFNLY
jgi:hypothetical protein